jgi:DMSO/TMAO reductase YedYZ molybdopterin-dependent catalytic subunit
VPAGDGRFRLVDGAEIIELTIESLRDLPQQTLDNCTIYSTGHDASGPFRFGGVAVGDLIMAVAPEAMADLVAVDVVSVDDFGTRLSPEELLRPMERLPLLAWQIDGAPMSRAQGLIRLIVPSERDDALRQVKWVAQVVIHRSPGE